MTKSMFTAQEIYVMASLMQKQKIYGIPDLFGEDCSVQLQEVVDGLTAQQIANVDIDGNISLAEEYHILVEFICECNACVAVNQQIATACTGQIFWKRNDQFLSAQWMDGEYAFAWVDKLQLQVFFDQLVRCSHVDNQGTCTTIPQIALSKAHRLCVDGQVKEAQRMLRQNGASERITAVISDGLLKQAYYVGLIYMQNTEETCETTELAYLASRDACLQLSQSVQNIRTCTVFSETDSEPMRRSMQTVASAFLL